MAPVREWLARRSARVAAVAGAVTLLAAAPGNAAVLVGSSGWEWGNPSPQGNRIRALSFAGDTGYAAGDFGTLLVTRDGGNSWAGLRSGTLAGLTEVQAIDGNSLFAGGGCTGLRSDDGGATIRPVALGGTTADRCVASLAAAWFVDESIGVVALADGSVRRTVDGGRTFVLRAPVPGTRAAGGFDGVADLRFLDTTTGVVVTTDGAIHHTTDGAAGWTTVRTGGAELTRVVFLDGTRGVAIGVGGTFLVTEDRGLTWTQRSLAGVGLTLRDVACVNPTTCVLVADGFSLARTDDGGATGSVQPPLRERLRAVAATGAGRIVLAGDTGQVLVSDDAGVSLSRVGSALTDSFNTVVAITGGRVLAPGDAGAIARSVDGGRTWVAASAPTRADLVDAAFVGPQAIVLASDGQMFRTSDRGATWELLPFAAPPGAAAIETTPTGAVAVAGPLGVRVSRDGGDTFAPAPGPIRSARLAGLDVGERALFAYGLLAIWRSLDDGRTWMRLPLPDATIRRYGGRIEPAGVRRLDFVSARIGFLLDDTGTLHSTTNGGTSWQRVLGVGSDDGYAMSFPSWKTGYLLLSEFAGAPGGYVLHTRDGGRSWAPQLVVADPLRSLAAFAPLQGVVLSRDQRLLLTATGGVHGVAARLSIEAAATRAVITVTGRLEPARPGTVVAVKQLLPGATAWRREDAVVAADGTFTARFRVAPGLHAFVAQWAGDFTTAGAGTPARLVRIGAAR